MNDIKRQSFENMKKIINNYCKIIFKVQTLEVYKNMKHIVPALIWQFLSYA